jgi:exosortase/archaeosortase family protein
VSSYRFYLAAFFLLFIVPVRDYKYSLLILASSLILIALRAASITIIQLVYPHDMILLLWIDPIIYIPMFAIILFVANRTPLLRALYNKINDKFSPLLIISLPQLVLLLLLLTPLPRVILNYLDKTIINGLVKMTLEISKALLNYFGYQTIVTSNFIFLGKFWLRLEQPCLGIGVVTIIWILINSVRGKWYNKFVFLTIFSILFVIMNSIRLSVLLVFIQNTYSSGLNKIELHDSITYFMYLFAFISFLAYYFWFQDVKLESIFLKSKKQV